MPTKLTLEVFLDRVKKIHSIGQYDYSKVKYINNTTKVNIFCNIHKKMFSQSPKSHLKGAGCNLCAIDRGIEFKTHSDDKFVNQAQKVHGNLKYDYSKTIYLNSKKKVEIICNIHGSFFVTPNDHLSKKVGCSSCGTERTTMAVQERYKNVGKEHLETAKKVHNNIYDYSKVIYTGCDDKVIIGCKKHGDFKMLLDSHATQKQGCPKCANEKNGESRSLKLNDFIECSIKNHKNLYSYESVILKNGSSKVKIFCKKCDIYFIQEAKVHMAGAGCTTCYHERSAIARALTTEEFIYKSQQVHGIHKYDYSMTKYINSRMKVKIKCNDCNYIFKTIPSDHMGKASGCPKCANLISKPEKEIVEFIQSLDIEVEEGTRDIIKNPNNGRKWELDIFLPEHNIAIEFNGVYFHSTARKSNINFHKEKTDVCLEKGIFLLHIFEDDFNAKKDFIFSRIKHLLGKSKTILSENTKLKIINITLASQFLNKNHLHGATKATFYYGLFYENRLISVAGFLKGRKHTKNNNMYELVRYASNEIVIGSLNKMLKEFKRNFSEILYTFCDNSFDNIQDYLNIGFIQTEEIAPDYKYLINSKRESKFKWKKKDIKSKLPRFYKENKTVEEMMIEAKKYKIYDCGKTRLEFYNNQKPSKN